MGGIVLSFYGLVITDLCSEDLLLLFQFLEHIAVPGDKYSAIIIREKRVVLEGVNVAFNTEDLVSDIG